MADDPVVTTISRRSAEVLLAYLGGDWRAYSPEELETARRELREGSTITIGASTER